MSNIIYFGTDVEVANCGVIIILPRLYQSSGSFFCRSNKLLGVMHFSFNFSGVYLK